MLNITFGEYADDFLPNFIYLQKSIDSITSDYLNSTIFNLCDIFIINNIGKTRTKFLMTDLDLSIMISNVKNHQVCYFHEFGNPHLEKDGKRYELRFSLNF
jgi:hypothetical protein